MLPALTHPRGGLILKSALLDLS